MSERKEGWYWVRLEDFIGWIPWEWRISSRSPEGLWFNSENPIEIGPRIPTPDEPWQTVPQQANEKMIVELMCTGLRHAEYVNGREPTVSEMQQGYQFMLSAAPKPGDA